MKERLYNYATMWLTLSVIFFIVEYLTEWLEVVTLGGLVAGAFLEGLVVNAGLGLMWLVVDRSLRTASVQQFFAPSLELLKAMIIVAAFAWEGVMLLCHTMPGYTMHAYPLQVLFLLIVYPAVAIALDISAKKEKR